MADSIDTGTGTTITFGTSDYAVKITEIGFDGIEKPTLDSTNLETTGSRTKVLGDLTDSGTLSASIFFDPSVNPIGTHFGSSQTITVTFPIQDSGNSTGSKLAGTGAITSLSFSSSTDELMVGNAPITWLGALTYTAEA